MDSVAIIVQLVWPYHALLTDSLPFQASLSMDVDSYRPYRTPYYETATKFVHRMQPASAHTASYSSLTIKAADDPLQCGKEAAISIKYVFTGETFNADSVDVIYLVRGSQIAL